MTTTVGNGNGANGHDAVELVPVSNDAEPFISSNIPYAVRVTLEGTSPILFHAWSIEAVKEKAESAKNSETKKTDNLESYVYRCENGNLGIPGVNLCASIAQAAKFKQDPRSPRKSAFDLYKASVIPITPIADLGIPMWESVGRHRVVVQRNAITRSRPSMGTGWRATFEMLVLTPEYISPKDLNDRIQYAGKLCGLCDYRPTYGRFQVVNFERMDLEP